MATNEAPETPEARPPGFDVCFSGLSVEVVIHPPVAPAEAPTVEAILTALERTPIEHINRGVIERALEELPGATEDVRVAAGAIRVPRGSLDTCAILVSHDGLAAYAVPTDPPARRATPSRAAPPDAGDAGDDAAADADAASPPPEQRAGATVTSALLRRLMTSERVTLGALDDVIDGFAAGKPLVDPVCVARGEEPVPGRDAELTYHFDAQPRLIPRILDDGSIDYRALLVERFVDERTVLVTRTPPVLGTAGSTVYGSRVDVPAVRDTELKELSGTNTTVEGDELIATIGGRPLRGNAGKIEVLPVYEVKGDVNYGVGNIDFPGDVIVRGDVRPGFTIRAGGAVVIRGVVEGASVTAEHDLAVAGVVGEQSSRFEVGGDLAAGYLHTTIADIAGTATVRREIVNCTLTAGRVTTSSTGRIVGGSVTAESEVDAGIIGAPNGVLTEVAVTSRSDTAVIRARRQAHAGSVLHIGGVRRQLEDGLDAASFWEVAGTLVSLPAGVDEAEVRKLRESPSAA